jgi:hypothetical protein
MVGSSNDIQANFPALRDTITDIGPRAAARLNDPRMGCFEAAHALINIRFMSIAARLALC